MPERNGRARIQIIRDKIEKAVRDDEALADATAMVEHLNTRLAANKTIFAWPTISAALISKHHWLVIACDSCGIVIDMDLTFKRRDPNASIRVALPDVRCPRCNGHGRTRITGLARFPSI
jgi:hypothetical protein